MTRDEVFRATGPTSGTKIRMKIGAKRDGTIVAASASLWYEAGAYRGSPSGAGAMCALAPYRIPNFFIEAYDVVVNKPKVAAYRAPGSPMAAFATESLIDEIARAARHRSDRAASEERASAKATARPTDRRTGRSASRQVLEAAQQPSALAGAARRRTRAAASPCGFWFNAGMNSSATVTLDGDGSAAVVTGNPDIGGTRAAQAMMVAEELGIPVERVRPTVADTDTAGYTDVTGGSRVCYATGMAVIEAADDVREQLRARAAKIWNVGGGRSVGGRPARAIPPDGAEKRQPLTRRRDRRASWRTPAVRSSAARRSTRRWPDPAFGAHICDLEVDQETGRSTRRPLHRDSGCRQGGAPELRRRPDAGRRRAGHRLGVERGVHVLHADGVMENAGFLDYRMPVASDLPMIDTVIVEVREPAASVRRARRRRSADRAAARRGRERDARRDRHPVHRAAAVAAARARGD